MGLSVEFIAFVFNIINIILTIYMWVIIIKALISWVNPDPYNPIVRFLNDITDPVLNRVRAIIPLGGIGIDFSPVIVIIAIFIIQYLLHYLEYHIIAGAFLGSF